MPHDIVIGIGNPIISDDAVGIEVARRLRTMVPPGDLAVLELYCGGLQLMEAMAGYERAVVVDAIETGGKPGAFYSLSMDDLGAARNTCTTHDGSLKDALELGRMAEVPLPAMVRLWAIEAGDLSTFRERLTPQVAAAVPLVASEIMRELFPDKDWSVRRIAE